MQVYSSMLSHWPAETDILSYTTAFSATELCYSALRYQQLGLNAVRTSTFKSGLQKLVFGRDSLCYIQKLYIYININCIYT